MDARGRHAASTGCTRVDLFSILLAGDFDPTLRAAFPGAVEAALGGDVTPMLRLRRRAIEIDAEPPPPRQLSSAVYAATSCEEIPMPWPRATPPDAAERHRLAEADAATIPDSAFEPFDRATALASDTLELCESWPAAPVAPDLGSGQFPDVPVLLVEGADDLRTPVGNAQQAAQPFPRAQVVVAPDTGHSAIGSDFYGCAQRAFARFIQRRRAPSGCPRRAHAFPAEPPPPRRLSSVLPLPGTPGSGTGARGDQAHAPRRGEDSLTALVFGGGETDRARGGGLRAGHYSIGSDGTAKLHGVAFVPGVTVTGRIERFLDRRRVRPPADRRPGRSARSHRGSSASGFAGRLGGRRVRGDLDRTVTVVGVEARGRRPAACPSRCAQASARPASFAWAATSLANCTKSAAYSC